MFHKTVHNVWNLFKRTEQLSENSILRVSIDWEELSIDQKLFSIDRAGIEHQLN